MYTKWHTKHGENPQCRSNAVKRTRKTRVVARIKKPDVQRFGHQFGLQISVRPSALVYKTWVNLFQTNFCTPKRNHKNSQEEESCTGTTHPNSAIIPTNIMTERPLFIRRWTLDTRTQQYRYLYCTSTLISAHFIDSRTQQHRTLIFRYQ